MAWPACHISHPSFLFTIQQTSTNRLPLRPRVPVAIHMRLSYMMSLSIIMRQAPKNSRDLMGQRQVCSRGSLH
eukprot:scaffold200092_cov14-Prasinocladus_malaysianus.AAC.1